MYKDEKQDYLDCRDEGRSKEECEEKFEEENQLWTTAVADLAKRRNDSTDAEGGAKAALQRAVDERAQLLSAHRMREEELLQAAPQSNRGP